MGLLLRMEFYICQVRSEENVQNIQKAVFAVLCQKLDLEMGE